MVLCLGLFLLVFLFHGLNVKLSKPYRKLSTHQKIDHAYQFLHTFAWGLHIVFPTHYLRKHLAVLSPIHVNLLLWLLHPCVGFDLILTCSMLNPYLGLLVSCTYPLSILQAVVVVGNCVDLSSVPRNYIKIF